MRPIADVSTDTIVVDASGQIAGRLASFVAKQLLMGRKVIVINAEKALIRGDPHFIIEDYKERMQIRTLASLEKSPKIPRKPDGMLRRMIRGMIPRRFPRGEEALSRLRVFVGCPKKYVDIKPITLNFRPRGPHYRKYLTLGELAKIVGGWKP